MAKREKTPTDVSTDTMSIVARLLALHLVKEMDNDEAMRQLGAVGFDDKTVSSLLGVTESSVRGSRFRRQKPKKRKTKL